MAVPGCEMRRQSNGRARLRNVYGNVISAGNVVSSYGCARPEMWCLRNTIVWPCPAGNVISQSPVLAGTFSPTSFSRLVLVP